MMDYLKTNVERILDDIGIPARDANGDIRSPDDLTEDVMALLEKCDGENAARLLFMITLAKHIDDESEQLEERFWGNHV